mgnify:FL=1
MITNHSNESKWILKNHASTIKFGESLAQELSSIKVLLLEGPLGAGKTSLVQGIGKGLEISEQITSPTFALSHHYLHGKRALFHLDLYRLEEPSAANELFLQEEEISSQCNGLLVIEWPSRLTISIDNACKIFIMYLANEGREIQIMSSSNEAKSFSTSEELG